MDTQLSGNARAACKLIPSLGEFLGQQGHHAMWQDSRCVYRGVAVVCVQGFTNESPDLGFATWSVRVQALLVAHRSA